jgi:hypothetical protein
MSLILHITSFSKSLAQSSELLKVYVPSLTPNPCAPPALYSDAYAPSRRAAPLFAGSASFELSRSGLSALALRTSVSSVPGPAGSFVALSSRALGLSGSGVSTPPGASGASSSAALASHVSVPSARSALSVRPGPAPPRPSAALPGFAASGPSPLAASESRVPGLYAALLASAPSVPGPALLGRPLDDADLQAAMPNFQRGAREHTSIVKPASVLRLPGGVRQRSCSRGRRPMCSESQERALSTSSVRLIGVAPAPRSARSPTPALARGVKEEGSDDNNDDDGDIDEDEDSRPPPLRAQPARGRREGTTTIICGRPHLFTLCCSLLVALLVPMMMPVMPLILCPLSAVGSRSSPHSACSWAATTTTTSRNQHRRLPLQVAQPPPIWLSLLARLLLRPRLLVVSSVVAILFVA